MPSREINEDDDDFDFEDEQSSEELEQQVQKAQAELGELKRRSEQIEKDKARLEELSRRQEDLEDGRTEMIDKLTRAMVVIERETEESQRRLEQLNGIQDSFLTHLRTLEAINPKLWSGSELPKELSKSLSAVDDAKAAHLKLNAKIAAEIGEEHAAAASGDYDEYYGSEKGFTYWLTAGFAFTLPLMVLAVILVVAFWALSGGSR